MRLQRPLRVVLTLFAAAATVACAGPGGVTAPDSTESVVLKGGPPASPPRANRLPEGLDPMLGREYFAEGLYQAVIDTLQANRPFSNVVLAEAKHVAALRSLYEKRELTPPAPPDSGDIVAIGEGFLDIQEACAYAVDLERQIGAGYGALLATDLPEDVARVLGNLKTASLDNHLVAFERCAAS